MFIHELKEADLYLGLIKEGFLVLDDFDGYVFLLLVVVSLCNLKKCIKKY